MAKKHMGLHKAHDHGAGMRANAAALMPEIANMTGGAGGGAPDAGGPPAMPQGMPQGAPQMPQPGMKKGGAACFKKGGPVKLAAGGVAKTRHGVATSKGAPMPPKVKFRGKAGIGS